MGSLRWMEEQIQWAVGHSKKQEECLSPKMASLVQIATDKENS